MYSVVSVESWTSNNELRRFGTRAACRASTYPLEYPSVSGLVVLKQKVVHASEFAVLCHQAKMIG
jgi:hypothetical protein